MSLSATFICYAREDSRFALSLADTLKGSGAQVWIDQRDITAGKRWDTAVQEALEGCHQLVVILTPPSVSSEHVMDEIAFALDQGKRVIPVVHQSCEIPLRLRRLQHIDLRTDAERGIARLLDEIRGGENAAPVDPGRFVPLEALPSARPAPSSRRPRPVTAFDSLPFYRQLLLLFKPSCFLAAVVHLFFSLSCAVVLFALFSDETADERLGIAIVWLAIAAFFHWLARLMHGVAGKPRRRRFFERILLLYWPRELSVRFLHVLYYILMFFAVIVLVFADTDNMGGDELAGTFGGAFLFAFMAILAAAVARRNDTEDAPTPPPFPEEAPRFPAW